MPDEIVDSDLHCAGCGYNLRTLTFSGRCPECGEPVAMSLRSTAFRFRNPATPKRVRNGITLFIAGVLLSAVLTLVLTGVMRLAYVIPDSLCRAVSWSLSYSFIVAQWLVMLGLIVATWPFGRRGDRFVWPLGVVVSMAIVMSAAPSVARFARWCLTGDGGPFSMGVPGMIANAVAGCAHFLAPTLAWVYLLARVRYVRNRALWLVMLSTVFVHFVLFASSVSSFVTVLQATRYVSVSGGTVQYMGPALRNMTLGSVLGMSGYRISAYASLITVAALWLYVRKLNRVGDDVLTRSATTTCLDGDVR
jgi:hypothetical protein